MTHHYHNHCHSMSSSPATLSLSKHWHACLTNAMPPVESSVTACAIRNRKCCILVLKYAVFSFSCRLFRFTFQSFSIFRFSSVSVFSIFPVLVLVFVNGIVILSFLVIFVFVFVNENHTACAQGSFLRG